MVNTSLIEYIRKYKDQYSVESLRTYLIRQGYNPAEIDNAIKIATRKTSKPLFKIFVVILAIFLVILAVYVWVSSESLEIFLKLTPQNQASQDSLVFQASFGASQKTSGRYTFSLYNQKNEKVLEESGYVDVNKESKLSFPIDVSNLQNGTYLLKFFFYASNKKVEDFFSFEVNRKQSSTRIEKPLTCPYSCDDNNPLTMDECVEGNCKNTLINKCGNNACDNEETVFSCPEDCKPKKSSGEDLKQKAISLVQSDPELAANTCLQLSVGYDDCLKELSNNSNNSKFCNAITNFEIKDSCYSVHALKNNDFTVCSLITDSIKQKACFSLKKASSYST